LAYLEAKSVNKDRDPQLERGVQEVLRMLEEYKAKEVVPPPYSTPAIKP
jgi:tricorn protease